MYTGVSTPCQCTFIESSAEIMCELVFAYAVRTPILTAPVCRIERSPRFTIIFFKSITIIIINRQDQDSGRVKTRSKFRKFLDIYPPELQYVNSCHLRFCFINEGLHLTVIYLITKPSEIRLMYRFMSSISRFPAMALHFKSTPSVI